MHTGHLSQAVDFGAELIRTGDLDPVYIALHQANLTSSKRKQLLLAYSCLYHLGSASAVADSPNFWGALNKAARSGPTSSMYYLRGTERRHWRGENAISCVEYLAAHFKHPEDVVDFWVGEDKPTFKGVSERVQSVPQFGPWIAFKVADLLERVLEAPVNFDDCELGIYSEPRKGAALLFHGDAELKITDEDLNYICNLIRLDPKIKCLKAPPSDNRKINVQEVETILCKYKSHVNGHYPPGKDTHEVIHGLETGNWGSTAKKLLRAVKLLERQWS